jgi:class 3 adenylate cyclase
MALKDELTADVRQIFQQRWTKRDGNVVPESPDVGLYNDGVKLEGTVLYADLSESTALVDSYKDEFAAEIYKSYLRCAAKIVTSEQGSITAYDGDRLMAVFLGDFKNTSATRSALKINYAVTHIINPLVQSHYRTDFEVKQIVGIDTSQLLVARTGIRGSNDLVWVGQAANYAAKLSTLDKSFPTWITSSVYNRLHSSLKVSNGRPMWESRLWTAMGNINIYRSNWWWRID